MSTRAPLDREATLADLEALPEHVRGEIIDGVLYTMTRPRPSHSNLELLLGGELQGPFQRGKNGPGGWWILVEPGVELPGSPELAPDLAGWRRERLPALPQKRIDIAPDWVCEILSSSTRGYDQRIKRPFYARAGVGWLWYIDLDARTMIASQLVDGRWSEVLVCGDDDVVRVPPFEEVELSLKEWWGSGSDT